MEPSSGPVDQLLARLLDQYIPQIPTDVWSPILTCFCIQSDVDMATNVYIHAFIYIYIYIYLHLLTRCRYGDQCKWNSLIVDIHAPKSIMYKKYLHVCSIYDIKK